MGHFMGRISSPQVKTSIEERLEKLEKQNYLLQLVVKHLGDAIEKILEETELIDSDDDEED